MIQIINCKCGKTFAAEMEPDCYTDKEWLRELTKYVKGGCTVKMVNSGEWQFEKCECKKQDAKVDLFTNDTMLGLGYSNEQREKM